MAIPSPSDIVFFIFRGDIAPLGETLLKFFGVKSGHDLFLSKALWVKAKGFLTQSLTFFCRREESQNGIFRKLRRNFVVLDYFKDIGKKYRNLVYWISCLSYKSWLV